MRPAQSPSQDAAVRAVGVWDLMLQPQHLRMRRTRTDRGAIWGQEPIKAALCLMCACCFPLTGGLWTVGLPASGGEPSPDADQLPLSWLLGICCPVLRIPSIHKKGAHRIISAAC